MKKLIALALSGAMIFTPIMVSAEEQNLEARVAALEARVAALEAQIGGSAPASESVPADVEKTAEANGITLAYKEHKVAKDYQGNDCVIIYFDFTNNSDKNCSPLSSTLVQVFQNGIQVDSVAVTDDELVSNWHTETMPGAAMTAGSAFAISDMSDITVAARIIGGDPVQFALPLQ